jgi:hypothetical protein
MNQPAYLWKNNRGIYFFRARIPKQFLEYFIGTEIKKSLKTDSLRLAVKLARAYRVELEKEMSTLEKGTYGAYQGCCGFLFCTVPPARPSDNKKAFDFS